jgi:MFS family permease
MNDSVQYPGFRWLVLTSAVLGFITVQLANLSMAPVLPQVAENLKINLGTASNLVMTTFLFSGCVILVLVGGAVCDKFGVLTSMILGTLCAAVPMALMPWIGQSPTGLAWARIIEGFSSGFTFPAMGPIIGLWFPNHQRGLAGGLMSASVAAGSAGGVMLGPVVVQHVSNWQAMCATLSIVGWVGFAFAAILAIMPKPKLPTRPAPPDGASDATVFKRILFSPLTLTGVLVTFMAAWGMQCLYGLTSTFLAADKPVGVGYGSMTAGQLMLGVTLFAGVVGPMVCGILLDRVLKGNAKVVLHIGFALMCVFVYLLTTPAVINHILVLEFVLILAGFGVQFVFPTIYYFIAKAYPPQVVGKMSGIWMGIGTFGGVLGLYIAGVTLKSQNSYHTTLLLQTLSAFVGFLLVFVLAAQKSSSKAREAVVE